MATSEATADRGLELVGLLAGAKALDVLSTIEGMNRGGAAEGNRAVELLAIALGNGGLQLEEPFELALVLLGTATVLAVVGATERVVVPRARGVLEPLIIRVATYGLLSALWIVVAARNVGLF